MGKNLYDMALDGIGEMIESVSDSVAKEFKNKNPFDKEPVSDDELLYEYNTKGYEVFNGIAETQGLPAAMEYKNQMDKIKQRRMGNG